MEVLSAAENRLRLSSSCHNPPMPLDYPDPDLEHLGVRLRRWHKHDIRCVEEAAQDPRIPQGTTVPPVYTREEAEAFIDRQHRRQTSGQGLSLAIVNGETDEARGLCFLGLGRTDGHCRIGYWIVPSARRKGMATAAITAVSRWVLTETHVYRLTALVEPSNIPSLSLLERCGFGAEGTLRSYMLIENELRDMVLMSLLRSDLE